MLSETYDVGGFEIESHIILSTIKYQTVIIDNIKNNKMSKIHIQTVMGLKDFSEARNPTMSFTNPGDKPSVNWMKPKSLNHAISLNKAVLEFAKE